jgi:hypothetical protein
MLSYQILNPPGHKVCVVNSPDNNFAPTFLISQYLLLLNKFHFLRIKDPFKLPPFVP